MFFQKKDDAELERKIEELTEKRDRLKEEYVQIIKEEKRRERIFDQRLMAMRDAKRTNVFYTYLDEEYQDTIYMERPYIVEVNAEMTLGSKCEDIFREMCEKYHEPYCSKAFRYVLHCEAVISGAKTKLVLADPYRRIILTVPEHIEMADIGEISGRKLIVKHLYFPFIEK